MRSLQLLSVLVTTCLPAAFADIINNTGPAEVITNSGATITGTYTVQDGNGQYLNFIRTELNGKGQPGIRFQAERATVNITYHTAHGHSGNRVGTYSGISICGLKKCAATQYGNGRDNVVVPYVPSYDQDHKHTAAKLMFSALACGRSGDALSLAQSIGRASGRKKNFKFKKANSKPATSQKSSGKPGAHVSTHPHPQSQRSNPGHLSRHHGGYRGKRHRGSTGNRGHGGRRGGPRDHGGHGHKGGNHHGGGRSQHHHVRSLCPGNSLACQRRRHHLAKRDSGGRTWVSPQGPVPKQGPSSPSGVAPTGGGTPKQSASGASGRAGSAGQPGPGLQSKAKKTQEGADSQQANSDPDSGDDRSISDISEALKRDLLSGKPRTVCIVGVDHLADMETAGITPHAKPGFAGAPGLSYEPFDAQDDRFWFKVTKVAD